ncbi:TIGR04149 family rSAM-modified RiPP [Paraflavisolibacter sp. H34]|uniref:TIGR04149 family rSAM-modified RiPP n=1 Tax=Huijunlia imazamoxiresistens TaxID=3127457 RepID=UPI003016AD83
MKKFKEIKSIKEFEKSKLTKEQMHQTTGGLRRLGCTCGTYSVCHVDGTDDGDGRYLFA